MVEKVLICVLANTRAYELTFPSFKKHVLDELDGDLALAVTLDKESEDDDPYWRNAKYCWTVPEFSDYAEAFDMAQNSLCLTQNVPAGDWRSLLTIKGNWQGGIRMPNPQPGAGAILLFCRWLLLQGFQRDSVLERYDRFVITRSDFVWLCPHPPLSVLDRDAIWFPDGESYGGLTDRHLVVSRADVVDCLNLIDDILLNPSRLYCDMKQQETWNIEQFLALHLSRKGLSEKVRHFPYVMYLARSLHASYPTWSTGRYEPAAGHRVKYEDEYGAARLNAVLFHTRDDWEKRSRIQSDALVPLISSFPLWRRLRYQMERSRPVRCALLGAG